jgi:hypothetical protein
MKFDKNGNPIEEVATDVNVGPSTTEETDDLTPEDPSSSEGRRKPGAEERISQLVAEREYWRGKAEAAATTPKVEPVATPIPEVELDPMDFDSNSDYLKAVAKQATDRIKADAIAERAKEKAQKVALEWEAEKEVARKKYPDFDKVALDPSVPVSQTMFDALRGKHSGDILYILGSNREEAARICSLPPVQQIKEIGKIESRLTIKPEKKISGAPPPPSTLSGAPSPSTKTEDNMSLAEKKAKWEADRKERIMKRYG